MHSFLTRHKDRILGVLSGFDRIVFRGNLRRICYAKGMKQFLDRHGILLKDFGDYAHETTERVKAASLERAEEEGRPVVYLPSSRESKEELARKIADRDGIENGLVAVFKTVEPCRTYELHKNREQKRLEVQSKLGKCLHLYHYQLHPTVGMIGARIQTWFPFAIQLTLNGREWLGRNLDRAGIAYRRADNCFPWIEDLEGAQQLMDLQLRWNWQSFLESVAQELNPIHHQIFVGEPGSYYWSVHQSEWATDVMFTSQQALAQIYPLLVSYAMTTFTSGDVMRFLGKRLTAAFAGEIVSDVKLRPEGVRIKHPIAAKFG